MKSKLKGRNKIMAINIWAVSLMKYGAGILKWNKNELQMIGSITRKVMIISKEFHPMSDVAFQERELEEACRFVKIVQGERKIV